MLMSSHDDKGVSSELVIDLVQELARLRQSEEALRDQNEELLEAQGLLEEARDDYSEIHDLAPLPLLTLSRSGIIRSANLAAAELLREERSQLVGRAFAEQCAPEDRPEVLGFLNGARAPAEGRPRVRLQVPGGLVEVDLRLRVSLRKRSVVHLTLLEVAGDNGQADSERLLRESESKDRMIAVLSHELRTPLAPALALASKMMRAPAVQEEELRDSLRIIERNLVAEARLIDDLLDATSLTHGKLRLALEPVEVNELLRECIEDARGTIDAKGLAVHFQPQATRSVTQADRLRLRQVFWNLLSNAVKYTQAQGVLRVRTSDGADEIEVEVADTGVGFPPNEGQRLFEAFEQLEHERRPGSGLGLGLSICKGLVELHGGTITARSEGIGSGSHFRVTLPVDSQALHSCNNDYERSSQPRVARSASVRRHCLLLIEDHADTLQVMTEVLEEEGYAVVTAASCQQALSQDMSEVDAIISDLGLPDGNALELLPRLRETRHVPALVLSGYGLPSDVEASRAAGFERHLTKPVDLRQLLQALSELLGLPAMLTFGADLQVGSR
jgi:signal transduction histidine kinase/CheY-like chemotaxis protein